MVHIPPQRAELLARTFIQHDIAMIDQHPKYDDRYWSASYPLADYMQQEEVQQHREFGRDIYLRSFIFGPKSLAIDLQIRDVLWPELNPQAELPTDVFVWAWGEPPIPTLTKIGGYPYLPKDIAWPADSDRKPMAFVAQINFCDSTDLVPSLPGNLLLIFSKLYISAWPGEPSVARMGEEFDDQSSMRFVFLNTNETDSKNVIGKGDAPDTGFQLWPLHGHIFRTSDHQTLYDEYVKPHRSRIGGMWVDPPAVLLGTKIGGSPVWEQEAAECLKQGLSLDFLCQVISDRADLEKPDPYIGHPQPFDESTIEESREQERRLCIADLGSLYLFWDGEKIIWEDQGG